MNYELYIYIVTNIPQSIFIMEYKKILNVLGYLFFKTGDNYFNTYRDTLI